MHFEVIWRTPWVVSLMYSYTIIPLVVSIIEANMVGCWVWCSSHFGRSKANWRMEPRNIFWKNFTNIDRLATKVGSNEAPGCTYEYGAVYMLAPESGWWLSMVHHILDVPTLEWSSNIVWKNFTNIDRLACYESWLKRSAWMNLKTWGRPQSLRRPWLVVEYGARHILDTRWPTGEWSSNIWEN
jgi:hypothetical protein